MNTEEKIFDLLEKLDGRMEGLVDKVEGLAGAVERHGEMLVQMQEDIRRINGRLDLDIGKRLDGIVEAQEAVEKRLDALDEVKALAEDTKDRVDVIYAVATQHSAAITELRQAR